MSKPLKKTDKGNRTITDFFARRSSMCTPSSSQLALSQPSLSQPTPAKKPGFKPGIKQTTKKKTIPSTQDKGAISISSSGRDDPILVSAKTKRSHASVSDDTSDSVAVISAPSKSNATVPTRAPAAPKHTNSRSTQSSAKTTIKRRAQPTAAIEASSSTAKLPPRRKRKLDWSDTSDEEMFRPDPNAMNAALTRAPVPRVVPSPPKLTEGRTHADIPSSPSAFSTSSKRRRLSSHDLPAIYHASGEEADVEEVPSSLSDEQELVLPKSALRGAETTKKNVDKWCLEVSAESSGHERSPPPSDCPSTSPVSSSPTHEIVPFPAEGPLDVEIDIDVDMADAADMLKRNHTLRHSESEAEVSQQLYFQEPSSGLISIPPPLHTTRATPRDAEPFVDHFRPHTPPPVEVGDRLSPLPPTPVALDTETKTRQWIERIKAEALEAAKRMQRRDSDDEIDLQSLSDSDDGDLSFSALRLITRAKTPPPRQAITTSSPLSTTPPSPTTDSQQAEAGPSSRYSLRRRDPVQGKKQRSSSPDIERLSHARPPKKPAVNPLDKLLREKNIHEKSGKGMEGVRRAEAVLRDETPARSKDEMLKEMDCEEDSENDSMWADKGAAMEVVRQKSRKSESFSLNTALEDDDSDSEEPADLDIIEATKHLGNEQGEAVGKILTKDRKGWLSKGRSKKRSVKGLSLWDEPDRDPESVMEGVSEGLVRLPCSDSDIESDRVLSLLHSAVESEDTARLSSLLTMQLLSRCKEVNKPSLVSWLFSLGLSEDNDISEQAHVCLLVLASRISTPCNLSNSLVRCLQELGANIGLLESCGLVACVGASKRRLSSETRSEHLSRITDIAKAFAENSAVHAEDVPDIIMALLLVGLESSSSAELRTEIMVAIDALGSVMPGSSSGYSDMEPVLCMRTLRFAERLTPVNKAYLMSFFCGSCPPMARVVRWLSHSLLLGDRVFREQPYSSLPALEPIVDLVSPMGGSKAMFDVVSGAEEEDYFDDLLCYVQILNRAFNDIPAYVQEEKRLAAANSQPTVTGASSVSSDKPKTELQRIKHSLDILHGKIVDTRAAHLDRSRVKAALQQLSFRIYYTREAALKWSRSARPAGLRAYFRKPTA